MEIYNKHVTPLLLLFHKPHTGQFDSRDELPHVGAFCGIPLSASVCCRTLQTRLVPRWRQVHLSASCQTQMTKLCVQAKGLGDNSASNKAQTIVSRRRRGHIRSSGPDLPIFVFVGVSKICTNFHVSLKRQERKIVSFHTYRKSAQCACASTTALLLQQTSMHVLNPH